MHSLRRFAPSEYAQNQMKALNCVQCPAQGTLSHIGPMTRTVLDAAMMMNVIARPDSRDPYEKPSPLGRFGSWLTRRPFEIWGFFIAGFLIARILF